MFKSAERDRAEGTLDRIGARVLEAWGSLTGRKSTKAKGKAARARGHMRQTRGAAKKGAR